MANNLIGQRFGKLVVLKDSGERSSGAIKWLCQCDCGNTCTPVSKRLKNGLTVSCGCHRKTCRITHGESNSRLYEVWASMKKRVLNPNSERYVNYGGRGIEICKEWMEYEPFSEWAKNNGYADNLSLDRVNVDGNYEPSNCRWVDNITQMNNTTANHYLEFDNKKLTIAEWSRETGINEGTIRSRLRRNWSIERALTEDVNK